MNIINVEEIYKVLVSRKKVSRVSFTLEEFKKYCRTIDALNELAHEETQFQGVNIERYMIPGKLEDLILPSRVCLFDTQRNSFDYRLRTNNCYTSNEVYSAGEFTDMSYSICGLLKWDSSELKPIERKEVVLTIELYSKAMSSDSYVNSQSCRPWALSLDDAKLSGYFGYDAEEAFMNYIRDAIK